MLSVAMFDAIDKAEVVFFINTENSVPKLEDSINIRNHTLSPWIYEEIVATKLIRKREWEEHRIVNKSNKFSTCFSYSKILPRQK